MSGNIRYPNINARNEQEKLQQVSNYLYQLVDQLNYTLKTIEAGGDGKVLYTGGKNTGSNMQEVDADAVASFNEIKGLIIKSADIVDAYYETISARLEGKYVAQSEFGTFTEETSQEFEMTSTDIKQLYTNIQEITDSVTELEHSLIEVNAHIKSGLLYYDDEGVPIYGLEIGQKNEIDGVEVFNKYARFTSDRLSFYDQNDTEVAYVSDYKLFITHAHIAGSLQVGGFVEKVMANGDTVTRWQSADAVEATGGDEE